MTEVTLHGVMGTASAMRPYKSCHRRKNQEKGHNFRAVHLPTVN